MLTLFLLFMAASALALLHCPSDRASMPETPGGKPYGMRAELAAPTEARVLLPTQESAPDSPRNSSRSSGRVLKKSRRCSGQRSVAALQPLRLQDRPGARLARLRCPDGADTSSSTR